MTNKCFRLVSVWVVIIFSASVENSPHDGHYGKSSNCTVKDRESKKQRTECLITDVTHNCTTAVGLDIRHLKLDRFKRVKNIEVLNYTIHDNVVILDISWEFDELGRNSRTKGFLLQVEDKTSKISAYRLLQINTTVAELNAFVEVRNFQLRNVADASRIHLSIMPYKERRSTNHKPSSVCKELSSNQHKELVMLHKDKSEICTPLKRGEERSPCSCWKNDMYSNFSASVLSVYSSNFCDFNTIHVTLASVVFRNNEIQSQEDKESCAHKFHNITDIFDFSLKVYFMCVHQDEYGQICDKILTCNVTRNRTTRNLRHGGVNSLTIQRPSPVVKESFSNINDKIQRLQVIVIVVAVVFSIIMLMIIVSIVAYIFCRKITQGPKENDEERRSFLSQNILLISHSLDVTKVSDTSMQLVRLMSCTFNINMETVGSLVHRLFGREKSLLVENLETRLTEAISDFRRFVFIASHDLIDVYQGTERKRYVQKGDSYIQTLIKNAINNSLKNTTKRHHTHAHFVSLDTSTNKYCKQLFSFINPPKGQGRKYCLVKDYKLKFKDLSCLVGNLSSTLRNNAIARKLENIDQNEWVRNLVPMNNCKYQQSGEIDLSGSNNSLEPKSSIGSTDTDPKEPGVSIVRNTENQNTNQKQLVVPTVENPNEVKHETTVKDIVTNEEYLHSDKGLNHDDLPSSTSTKMIQKGPIDPQQLYGSVQNVAEVHTSLTDPKRISDDQSTGAQQETGYFSNNKEDDAGKSVTVCKELNTALNNTHKATTASFIEGNNSDMTEPPFKISVTNEDTNTQLKGVFSFLPQSAVHQLGTECLCNTHADESPRNEPFTYLETSRELHGLSYHQSGGFCTNLDNQSICEQVEYETTV